MKTKTFKREAAWLLLLCLIYLSTSGDTAVLEIVVWPFITFAATAFGMDWLGKQTQLVSKGGQSVVADK